MELIEGLTLKQFLWSLAADDNGIKSFISRSKSLTHLYSRRSSTNHHHSNTTRQTTRTNA